MSERPAAGHPPAAQPPAGVAPAATEDRAVVAETAPDVPSDLGLGDLGLIVPLAFASGAAGLFPVPWLAQHAVAGVRRALVQVLARRCGVPLKGHAASAIVGDVGPTAGQLVSGLIGSAARRDGARLLRLMPLLLRLDDVVDTLLVGCFFLRYCRRWHTGEAIGTNQGHRLGEAVAVARRRALRGALEGLLLHAVGEAWGVVKLAPQAVGELLAAALRSDAGAVERTVDHDTSGVFGRAAALVARQLHGAGRAAVEGVLAGFDQAWERAERLPHHRRHGILQ